MTSTLCISSIPNSSLSLYCGKKEGGEEGERMERRVRKAQRRGGARRCRGRLRGRDMVHDISGRDKTGDMLVHCFSLHEE